MQYTEKISLSADDIRLIIRSIQDGQYVYDQLNLEHPTETHNGSGLTKWDYIFTEIKKNFTKSGFQVHTLHNGFFHFTCIFDEKTKFLYTFMREQNYHNLHKKKMDKRLFHYENILARINSHLLDEYELQDEQLSFGFPTNYIDYIDNELANNLNTMTSKINDKILRYTLVLFKQEKGIVTDISCIIPVQNNDSIFYEESWNDYLGAEYKDDTPAISFSVPEENDINLVAKDINLTAKSSSSKRTDSK